MYKMLLFILVLIFSCSNTSKIETPSLNDDITLIGNIYDKLTKEELNNITVTIKDVHGIEKDLNQTVDGCYEFTLSPYKIYFIRVEDLSGKYKKESNCINTDYITKGQINFYLKEKI